MTSLPQLDGIPRLALQPEATPIRRLEKLERALTETREPPRLYAKRDDLNVFGGGGNKLRKLEFLIGAALQQGCDTFIATGGRQSNFARLAAAASAYAGLRCELVLTDIVPRSDDSYRLNGNVLLDEIFGAQIHYLPGNADARRFAEERAADLRTQGRRAYIVGLGGSSPVGSLGYAACAAELATQEAALGLGFTHIILPNGSAGTHAGLAAGFTAMQMDPSRIQAFTVLAPLPKAHEATVALTQQVLALIAPDQQVNPDAIKIDDTQLGDGYGMPTRAMFDAVQLMARTEGLLLDPVYSGKAFAGLLAMIRDGALSRDAAVLFLVTGGTPGLFAYEPAFRGAVSPGR